MKFDDRIPVYGDVKFRGGCPSEALEMATFFNRILAKYPTHGAIALHIRNEGKRSYGQVMRQKAEGGFVSGACDIIIPGMPTFCCEMKRKDHTKSKWQDGQVEYLIASQEAGAFVCVALGMEAAWNAFLCWK